jgi:hypothetical protein
MTKAELIQYVKDRIFDNDQELVTGQGEQDVLVTVINNLLNLDDQSPKIYNGFIYWNPGADPLSPVTGDIREGWISGAIQLQEFDNPDAPGVWANRSGR